MMKIQVPTAKSFRKRKGIR